MSRGVARQVDRLDRDTTEVPDVPVLESEGIRSRAVVELGQQGLAKVIPGVTRKAVPVEHPVDRLRSVEIVGVDVNSSLGKGRVARHVVLMGVAIDDRVDRQPDPAGCGHRDRRVDDHGLGVTRDEKRVA